MLKARTKRSYVRKTRRRIKGKRKVRGSNSYSTSMASNYPSRLILRGNIGGVMPDEYFCTLKYTTVIQHFSASGFSNQIFYANSLYDPDYTHALNHQPMGFDQLGYFYQKYQVLGCKMEIQLNNNSSTVPIFATYGFSVNNPVFFNDLYFPENPYIKTMQVGTASGNGSGKTNIQCSIKKMLGHKNILEDERTWGLVGNIGVGTSPADFVFAFCNVISDDQVSTVNAYGRYTLSFHARFFQRLNLVPSFGSGSTGHSGATGSTVVSG